MMMVRPPGDEPCWLVVSGLDGRVVAFAGPDGRSDAVNPGLDMYGPQAEDA